MCPYRGEKVTTVKGVGDLRQPILGPIKVNKFRRPLHLSGAPHTCRQNTVIGGNEEMLTDSGGDRPTLGTDTWIDDNDVDGAVREEERAVVDDEARLENVLGRDLVAQVGNNGIWRDAIDGAVKDGAAALPGAEIGGERDEGHRVIVARYSHPSAAERRSTTDGDPVTAPPKDIQSPGLWPTRKPGKRHAEEGARSALIAAASTVVLIGVVLWWILTSEAWPAVQRQFFNGEHFWASLPDVLGGFWLDIQMFLVAEVLILFLALVLAMIRSLRGPAFFPLRALVIAFIDLIRGVPIILLILLLGFGIPALQLSGVPSSPLFWGVATLVISYSAYTAEVYRAGIESVHESQRMAARSLGLTQVQTLRYVLVPQAIRNVIPALLNGFVSLQKDVALVYVLGVREGVREAQIYIAGTFNYTPYIVATILFLLVSVPVARFTDWYTERDKRRRQAVGG